MKLRFVVIDDAAFLRELIKNIMSSVEAICVGEADDGDLGAQVVQQTLPDLVFLDMVMPKKNGIETAKTIKESNPDVKIIGCSTIDQEALIQKAIEAGFDNYIQKPFSKEQLISAVRKVIPQLEETSHGRT